MDLICVLILTWSWIVLDVWFTDEKLLALFPVGTIIRDLYHHKSANVRHAERNIWTCAKTEFRLCWTKLCGNDNHYITAPQAVFCSYFVKLLHFYTNVDHLTYFIPLFLLIYAVLWHGCINLSAIRILLLKKFGWPSET